MIVKAYRRRLQIEPLEPRLVLSFVFAAADLDEVAAEVGTLQHSDHHRPGHGGGGGGQPATGPAIDLFTVALHEFGHSLGLAHSDPNDGVQAVMDPFYSGAVTGLKAQDIARIQALYPESGPGSGGQPWTSTDITYSYTPDGARMDQGGRNTLFKTMNTAFGGEAAWQSIFASALETWAAATRADGTNTELVFTQVSDNGARFNSNGAAQGDSRFGDIRVATHGFDGASGVLAHAYYPPPNGITAAGDAHFDKAENWSDLDGAISSTTSNIDRIGGGRHSHSAASHMTLLMPTIHAELVPDLATTPLTTSPIDSRPAPLDLSSSTIVRTGLSERLARETMVMLEVYRSLSSASMRLSSDMVVSDGRRDDARDPLELIDDALAEWSDDDRLPVLLP